MYKCPKCEYTGIDTSDIGAHLNSKHRGTSYKQSDIEKVKVNISGSRNKSNETDRDTGN